MGEFDGEIGRGRQRGSTGGESSGSSRESSKERLPVASNRIASPEHTDDGDSRMQTVADDDTPPPAARPLIRQALGFSFDKPPTSISTYEAAPETVPNKTFFLPGQVVAQPKPDKPKDKGKSKNRDKDKTKKPRIKRTDAYPGQQSRFRIQTYDPTPTGDPPTDHGTGPYASMYRGTSGTPQDNARDNSVESNGDPSSTIPPTKTPNATRTKSAESRSSTATSSKSQPPAATPASNRNRMQAAKAKSLQPDYQPSNQRSSGYLERQPPHPHYAISTSHPTASPAYHASSSLPPQSSSNNHQHERQNFSREHRVREHQHTYSSSTASYEATTQSEAPRTSKYPLRMVTVLIQDLRSGTIDHQLAEVKVPLRPNDETEDGYWADSKDIAFQLQRGPSRIDGPARAYTLRGKYRQFILRVTAENQDEIMSANVTVHQNRTFDLVIEMLPSPGGLPMAPKIPTELLRPSYEDTQSHTMDIDSRSPHVNDGRKRPNSPSFDDYDGSRAGSPTHTGPPIKAPRHSYMRHYSPVRSSRHASPHYTGTHHDNDNRIPVRRQSVPMDTSPTPPQYTFPMPPIRQSPHSAMRQSPLPAMRPSPPPATPPEARMHTIGSTASDDESLTSEADEEFVGEVDRLLQEDITAWTSFYKAKAGNKVADVLKQYEFIRQKSKSLRGRIIQGFRQPITDDHIVQALKVEEKDYLYMCNKTMDLMMLYGKQGRLYEDSKVQDLINDTSPPKYGSNPYKRLLHLLEDIDQAWHNGKTEPRQRPQQSHSPSITSQALGHANSHSDSQRSRKDFLLNT